MELKRYENEENIVNTDLFKEDEYTFFVLSKIVNSKSRLVITDHNRLIVCHSCSPFPVWIWLPDEVSEQEMETAWQIIKNDFSFDDDYSFNVKHFFAEYMIKRAKEENIDLGISVNMLAYNCPKLIEPKKAKGSHCLATIDNIEEAADFIAEFHEEIGIDKQDKERYRFKAQNLIEEKRLYFWKNEDGKNVAMCSYNLNENKGGISNVYTKTDERRRGYAANLVYEITKFIAEQGKIPVIYTDADYKASNACYEGIGYRLKGSLCTVAKNLII